MSTMKAQWIKKNNIKNIDMTKSEKFKKDVKKIMSGKVKESDLVGLIPFINESGGSKAASMLPSSHLIQSAIIGAKISVYVFNGGDSSHTDVKWARKNLPNIRYVLEFTLQALNMCKDRGIDRETIGKLMDFIYNELYVPVLNARHKSTPLSCPNGYEIPNEEKRQIFPKRYPDQPKDNPAQDYSRWSAVSMWRRWFAEKVQKELREESRALADEFVSRSGLYNSIEAYETYGEVFNV